MKPPKTRIRLTEFNPRYKSNVKSFLLSILEGEFGHYDVLRPDLDKIEKYYQSDRGNFWTALQDEKVVGTVGLKDYGNGIGYLQRMSVHKEFRGTGLAQKLLETAEDFAKEYNYKAIYLATSENLKAANKFYAKEGYVRIETLPSEIPTPIANIYYKKQL